MNLTPREQEIHEAITVKQVVGYAIGLPIKRDVLSAEKLAQFLARMEGSKEEEISYVDSRTPEERAQALSAIKDYLIATPTPPSEEKKCCDNIGGKNTHWQDCPFTPSPTPPGAWGVEIRRDWREEVKKYPEMDALGSSSWWLEKMASKKKEWEKIGYDRHHDEIHENSIPEFICVKKQIQTQTRTTTLEEVERVVEGKKKHWHIKFEGHSKENQEAVRYNEEVSMHINSVLNKLLTHIKEMRDTK